MYLLFCFFNFNKSKLVFKNNLESKKLNEPTSKTILVKTVPVDPRDFLSGNYSIFSNIKGKGIKIFYCHSLPKIFFEFNKFAIHFLNIKGLTFLGLSL